MRTLYVIHHSPWSERARWALLHHELTFREKEHVPLVGEFALRRRAKRKGKVSVPLLVEDDGQAIQGSMEIAEHADKIGTRPTLFPPGEEAKIREAFDAIEDSICAARERFGLRLKDDTEAQIDVLPPLLRKLPFAGLSAKLGTSFIKSKWEANKGSIDDRIRAGMTKVRELVGGKPYVLSEFSFADIVCTSVVQVVRPVDSRFWDFSPPMRRVWSDDAIAEDFGDVIAWRDSVYEKHRPATATQAAE